MKPLACVLLVAALLASHLAAPVAADFVFDQVPANTTACMENNCNVVFEACRDLGACATALNAFAGGDPTQVDLILANTDDESNAILNAVFECADAHQCAGGDSGGDDPGGHVKTFNYDYDPHGVDGFNGNDYDPADTNDVSLTLSCIQATCTGELAACEANALCAAAAVDFENGDDGGTAFAAASAGHGFDSIDSALQSDTGFHDAYVPLATCAMNNCGAGDSYSAYPLGGLCVDELVACTTDVQCVQEFMCLADEYQAGCAAESHEDAIAYISCVFAHTLTELGVGHCKDEADECMADTECRNLLFADEIDAHNDKLHALEICMFVSEDVFGDCTESVTDCFDAHDACGDQLEQYLAQGYTATGVESELLISTIECIESTWGENWQSWQAWAEEGGEAEETEEGEEGEEGEEAEENLQTDDPGSGGVCANELAACNESEPCAEELHSGAEAAATYIEHTYEQGAQPTQHFVEAAVCTYSEGNASCVLNECVTEAALCLEQQGCTALLLNAQQSAEPSAAATSASNAVVACEAARCVHTAPEYNGRPETTGPPADNDAWYMESTFWIAGLCGVFVACVQVYIIAEEVQHFKGEGGGMWTLTTLMRSLAAVAGMVIAAHQLFQSYVAHELYTTTDWRLVDVDSSVSLWWTSTVAVLLLGCLKTLADVVLGGGARSRALLPSTAAAPASVSVYSVYVIGACACVGIWTAFALAHIVVPAINMEFTPVNSEYCQNNTYFNLATGAPPKTICIPQMGSDLHVQLVAPSSSYTEDLADLSEDSRLDIGAPAYHAMARTGGLLISGAIVCLMMLAMQRESGESGYNGALDDALGVETGLVAFAIVLGTANSMGAAAMLAIAMALVGYAIVHVTKPHYHMPDWAPRFFVVSCVVLVVGIILEWEDDRVEHHFWTYSFVFVAVVANNATKHMRQSTAAVASLGVWFFVTLGYSVLAL